MDLEHSKKMLLKYLDEVTLDEFQLLEDSVKYKLAFLLGTSAFEEMRAIANNLRYKE